MSQYTPPGSAGTFNDPYDQQFIEPQKTSGLAIAALICSLVFCCPLTTILGIVLGAVALMGINKNPLRKGKGIAIAAIVLGLIFTVAQAVVYPIWIKQGTTIFGGWMQHTMKGPEAILKKGFAGDVAGFQAEFIGAGSAVPASEAQAFLDELQKRYGAFVSADFDQKSGQQPQGKPGTANVPFPYVLTFTNKKVNAETELIFADTSTGKFMNKFGYIVVFDPDLGDVAFPANATATNKPRTRGSTSTTAPAATQSTGGNGG